MVPPHSRVAVDYKPAQTGSRTPAHALWFASGLLVPLIGGIIAFAMTTRETPVIAPPQLQDIMALASPPPLPMAAPGATPIPAPLGETVEFVVRRNDTLDRIFRQLKLSLTDLASIRDLPGIEKKLDQLRPGDTITVIHDDGAVQSL